MSALPSELPPLPGVTPALRTYARSDHVATDYDAYHAYNRLFEFDEQVLFSHFKKQGLVVDLGCGTGRALVPLARRGFSGLAVDLSLPMLREVAKKAAAESLSIQCVQANLVELDGIAEASVDYAICLFSTLGMIRGRANRLRILEHARRILKPGGLFVVHVHNYWYSLFDRGGPWWMLTNWLRSCVARETESGDKCFPYCGVPDMFLHVYTRGELTSDLRRSGLAIQEVIALAPARVRELRSPWLLGSMRANGWIAICEKKL